MSKIIINLDMMLVKRKMSLTELSEKINIHITKLSMLKKGRTAGIRFETLALLCDVLECEPNDLLEFRKFN